MVTDPCHDRLLYALVGAAPRLVLKPIRPGVERLVPRGGERVDILPLAIEEARLTGVSANAAVTRKPWSSFARSPPSPRSLTDQFVLGRSSLVRLVEPLV